MCKGVAYHNVSTIVLETVKDVFLEMLHVPLPSLIVAVGAAVDDKTPFVESRVNHAPECGGQRLARPVVVGALSDEPLKPGRRHF